METATLKNLLKHVWQNYNWYCQDVIVAGLVIGLALLAWRLSRREYWRMAMRQVFSRPLAVISFVILCLYLAVALLDSVGYHPPLRDGKDEIQRNPEGKILFDDVGLSVLDLMLTGLLENKEKSYSAPFAKEQFGNEIMVNDAGEVVYGNPPLKHPGRHWLGTDKVGRDVIFLALKGVRTGIVIGAVTVLLAIPFAILFGVVAGYFGGWVDDVIQYVYTVIASIPGILLIIAFMLIFERGLMQLCIIMGITSWTGLCRVLRGETMKLREMEFVQAAEAMGVAHWRILARHIVPNVLHIVLITAVLNFSGNVLAESVLTYIGIGVGSDTFSWGQMIFDARQELARDPVVWWKLSAAFVFMLGLVLPANFFGDTLRDALDPRLRIQ